MPVTLSANVGLQVASPAKMLIGAQARAGATASLQYAYAPIGLGTDYSNDDRGGSETNVSTNPVSLFACGDTTAPQTFTFVDQTTG